MSFPPNSRSPIAPMPSFQSVFGQDVNNMGTIGRSATETSSPGVFNTFGENKDRILAQQAVVDPPSLGTHQHRDSTSTITSESTDSSPTTTISTIDSSSVTEPSPGSSPQSPATKSTMQSFSANLRPRTSEDRTHNGSQFFELQRSTTPPKKPRNLKGLAVNTSGQLGLGRAISTASLPMQQDRHSDSSDPDSQEPTFVKPHLPKRRQSNLGLSIQPVQSIRKPSPQEVRIAIPPTPSFKKPNMLRHFQSSPSLPLFSPSVSGPEGGMQLPPIQRANSSFVKPSTDIDEDEDEPNFDVPQSREDKPESYPNGPICIYDSGLDLFLEPTADVAGRYDVVFNVASEVKNPFEDASTHHIEVLPQDEPTSAPKSTMHAQNDSGIAMVDAPIITTSSEDLPNKLQRADIPQSPSSPTTPKATPSLPPSGSQTSLSFASHRNTPEYIHIPWEHNTDIVPDLFRLVRMIDDRIQQQKRVLVHCQCGVSRSASLVVAYGLYKKPQMSVQEAYDAVKRRSKWIGPNMNLIMQLQEFRSGLLKAERDPAFYSKVYGTDAGMLSARRANNANGLKSATTPQALDGVRYMTPSLLSSAAKESGEGGPVSPPLKTAPLPPEDTENKNELKLSEVAKMEVLSPGPSSAPSGMPWPLEHRRSWGPEGTGDMVEPKDGLVGGESDFVSPMGNLVPASNVGGSDIGRRPPPSPLVQAFSSRHDEFHTHSFSDPRPEPDFGLLSPRTEGFGSLDGMFPSASRAQPRKPEDDEPLASPRSAEFNMHDVHEPAPEADYGLLSPRTTEPHNSPFIPAPVSKPTTSSASISSITRPLPFRQQNHILSPLLSQPITEDPAAEEPVGLSTPPRPRTSHHVASSPSSNSTRSLSPSSPTQNSSPPALHSTSPSSRRLLRPKFSAPNLQTQIRLRELQADLASRLAHAPVQNNPPDTAAINNNMPGGFPTTPAELPASRDAFGASLPPPSNKPTSIDDKEETLLSPRAEEFTRNPFHFDLSEAVRKQKSLGDVRHRARESVDHAPGGVSLDSLMSPGLAPPMGFGSFMRPQPQQQNSALAPTEKREGGAPLPVPAAVAALRPNDPRSPAMKGVSPITRNIWDVL